MSGGNDDIKYYASVGYTTQDGMWSTTYLKKYNGSLNVTAKIDQAMRQAPTKPICCSNGDWTGYIGQSLIGEIYHSGYGLNENSAVYSQFYIEQKLAIPPCLAAALRKGSAKPCRAIRR